MIVWLTYTVYLSDGWSALLVPVIIAGLVTAMVWHIMRQPYEPYQEPKAKQEERIDLTKMGAPK